MNTKTLFKTAAATFILAGTIGFSATGASAHDHHHHKGSGIYIGLGGGHQVCQPEFKKKVWWSNGKKHVKTIYVGQNCYWQPYILGY